MSATGQLSVLSSGPGGISTWCVLSIGATRQVCRSCVAQVAMSSDHCNLCPFAGCPGCNYQPEQIPGQLDLLNELEDDE